MRRRELYRFVDEIAGTAPVLRKRRGLLLLHAAADAMAALRGMPRAKSHASIPSQFHKLLDREDVRSILRCDDALGQLYQAINAPALEAAYRATSRDGMRKFRPSEIPAVTQLFTPRWVVEFLVENTLGLHWLEMHPDSKLGAQVSSFSRRACSPFMPNDSACTHASLVGSKQRARDLRILDPACGTMNFGVVAIEWLEAMYCEELDRAGQPGWPAEPSVLREADIFSTILHENLVGIDIDPLALELARVTLSMKVGRWLTPEEVNLLCGDALFDASIATRCNNGFDVIVTNPPFLSARNLPAPVVARLKNRFTTGARDLYACFILRALEMLREGGRAGILSMHSFMFTGSFEALRREIFDRAAVETIAHFGPRLFDVGNPGTLQTVAFAMRRETDAARRDDQQITAHRLVDGDAEEKSAALAAGSAPMYPIAQRDLATSTPRAAWAYWVSPRVREIFATMPKLADISPPRQGLATTDNARFVRWWWEVERPVAATPATPLRRATTEGDAGVAATDGTWFPYAKGDGFARWWSSPRHVVNWADDGCEIKAAIVARYPYLDGKWEWVAKNSAYYGRAGGVTYSYLTSGEFSARLLPAGTIFDVAGSSLFPPRDPLAVLGILNSRVARHLLEAINPTVNFQVGDVGQLPIPKAKDSYLCELVAEAVEIRRRIEQFDESSPAFTGAVAWDEAADVWHDLHQSLARREEEIDERVADLFSLKLPTETAEKANLALDRGDLARRWVGVALRHVLNECGFLVLENGTHDASERTVEALSHLAGESAARQINQAIGGIDAFLRNDFYPWHVRLYRKRPPIWMFGDATRAVIIRHDRATRSTIKPLLKRIGRALPAGWDRVTDDGIAVNFAPLHAYVADRSLSITLREIWRDMNSGRYAWAMTARGEVRASRKLRC